MTARFTDHILPADVVANRPAATAVPDGTLFPATDTGIIYQSDGTAWATWATLGGAGYTDEQVRDVMGTALVAGSNVTITPDDAGDTITIDAAATGGSAALWARKTVNESVTSSTTLQDDNELSLALEANSTYRFEAMLLVYGHTSADMKMLFPRASAGWEVYWAPIAPASDISASDAGAAWYSAFSPTADTTLVIGTATLSNTLSVHILGNVTTDATAGNLKLQWAQNSSNATAVTVYRGSHLMAQKVA